MNNTLTNRLRIIRSITNKETIQEIEDPIPLPISINIEQPANPTTMSVDNFITELIRIQDSFMKEHRLRLKYSIIPTSRTSFYFEVSLYDIVFANQRANRLFKKAWIFLTEKIFKSQVYTESFKVEVYSNGRVQLIDDYTLILPEHNIFSLITNNATRYMRNMRQDYYWEAKFSIRDLNDIQIKTVWN